ncbi:hypothetical protein CH063_08422 [Colletotrichum higginsianum]|uniref:Uncharacterized protein n=1 Tax=Colletotrichum higginsianum (strain IMI 349063) TaxID=759273 RepID=H1V9T8_COLHI|nr:hypothetical protein CH063_08422 [Colletotrichum higginsianum]
MPSGQGYEYKSSGTNSQARLLRNRRATVPGNHYCARDYGSSASNPNSYHYSNTDGSYYYSNPNGSTYYNDGAGGSTYTSSSGERSSSGSGSGSGSGSSGKK